MNLRLVVMNHGGNINWRTLNKRWFWGDYQLLDELVNPPVSFPGFIPTVYSTLNACGPSLLCAVCSVLCAVCCAMCSVLSEVFSLQCALQRAVCFAACSLQCAMYSV